MLQFPADDSVPQRVLLQSRSEVVPAIVELLRRARREVRCLHHDLAPFALAQTTTVDALHAFLHSSRYARLRLLVDATDWLDTQAARLRLLQRQLAHAIEIRQASSDDPVGDDAALIVDDRHALLLVRSAHAIGEAWLNSQPRAQALMTTFDRRWEAGAHNLPVDPLGL